MPYLVKLPEAVVDLANRSIWWTQERIVIQDRWCRLLVSLAVSPTSDGLWSESAVGHSEALRWGQGCEECVADTSAWFALGGVALAGVMGFATAGLTHRWGERARIAADREQEIRTIRDQRREACHNYLVATNSYYQAIDQLHLKAGRGEEVDPDEHVRAAITALQDSYVYLTISCGADVRELARSYNMTLYKLRHTAQGMDADAWSNQMPETHDVRKRLRAAMRAELGIQD